MKIKDVVYGREGKGKEAEVVRRICQWLTDYPEIVAALSLMMPKDYEMYIEDFDPEAPRVCKGDIELDFLWNKIMDLDI